MTEAVLMRGYEELTVDLFLVPLRRNEWVAVTSQGFGLEFGLWTTPMMFAQERERIIGHANLVRNWDGCAPRTENDGVLTWADIANGPGLVMDTERLGRVLVWSD